MIVKASLFGFGVVLVLMMLIASLWGAVALMNKVIWMLRRHRDPFYDIDLI